MICVVVVSLIQRILEVSIVVNAVIFQMLMDLLSVNSFNLIVFIFLSEVIIATTDAILLWGPVELGSYLLLFLYVVLSHVMSWYLCFEDLDL